MISTQAARVQLDASACTCGAPIDNAKPLVNAAPFDAVQAFQSTCSEDMRHYNDYYVAVKAAGRWYGELVGDTMTGYHGAGELDFNGSVTRGAMLIVDFMLWGSSSDGLQTSDWHSHTIAAFGVGPSHVPSAAEIKLSDFSEDAFDPRGDNPPKPQIGVNTDLALTWRNGATFSLAGKTTGLDAQTASITLGSHTLVFP